MTDEESRDIHPELVKARKAAEEIAKEILMILEPKSWIKNERNYSTIGYW